MVERSRASYFISVLGFMLKVQGSKLAISVLFWARNSQTWIREFLQKHWFSEFSDYVVDVSSPMCIDLMPEPLDARPATWVKDKVIKRSMKESPKSRKHKTESVITGGQTRRMTSSTACMTSYKRKKKPLFCTQFIMLSYNWDSWNWIRKKSTSVRSQHLKKTKKHQSSCRSDTL